MASNKAWSFTTLLALSNIKPISHQNGITPLALAVLVTKVAQASTDLLCISVSRGICPLYSAVRLQAPYSPSITGIPASTNFLIFPISTWAFVKTELNTRIRCRKKIFTGYIYIFIFNILIVISVLISKFIYLFFLSLALKLLTVSAAMLANFALFKEKTETKVCRPI